MAGARPKSAGATPRPLECSRDHVLVYDARLRGPNVFRAMSLGDRLVRIEALVKLGEAMAEWAVFTALLVDRNTPPESETPSLVRAGAGDGTTWRIPPWRGWEPKYAFPMGTSFLLIRAPAVWPEAWS